MKAKGIDYKPVRETKLPLPLVNRGKVRDIYAVGEDKLLIVTTDRLSAFDVVLSTPIADKGRVLNQISLFWFEKFKALVPNHVITSDVEKMGLDALMVKKFYGVLTGRSLLAHRAKPLPVECVVRGFITGSGWKDYQKTGKVCGQALPSGMKQCEEISEPIFTPATKASVGHDMNINLDETARLVGKKAASQIEALSILIYKKGTEFAKTRGILIADTKFEFGTYKEELILIDEVLTPDSSRFWPKEKYQPGHDQPSLDKQIVRNWLIGSGWDQTPPGPVLPSEVVRQTSAAYKAVYKQLTGRELV